MTGDEPPLSRPRFVPERPLPPYSYVPGRFPHPASDPQGHSFGIEPDEPEPPDPERWASCREYLFGIDLFNHGYYWEAHEVWEGLWHASGRTGTTGHFLKGLIKLAAAGVKAREGKPEGVRRHAARSAELFRGVLGNPDGRRIYMGLDLEALIEWAGETAEDPPEPVHDPSAPVAVVFPFVLSPK